jgi:peptidoglycan/LPS O-acetylase OafA/YrhL
MSIHPDTKFISLKFLKIFLVKTLILWLAVLLAFEGKGTYVQFPIFYSWLSLPAFMHLSHNSLLWEIYSYSIPIIFFAISTILALFMWFDKKAGKRLLYNALMIHSFGAILTIIYVEHDGAPLSTSFALKLAGGAVSLAVSYYFWRIFFRIADYKHRRRS